MVSGRAERLAAGVTMALFYFGRFQEWSLQSCNKFLLARGMDVKFPPFIGLMLSRVCDAHCIFCPISRQTTYPEAKFMSFRVAKKVVDELAERDFHGIINLGENGDALLNPEFDRIIEYIFRHLKKAQIILFTNAKYLNEQTSALLLKASLSKLLLNIDGGTKETYEFAKPNCDFEKITKNLKTFIKLRTILKSNCKIQIYISPPKRYMELRENKKVDIPYDADKVTNYWRKFLLKYDEISEPIYFFNWTHRTSLKRTKSCPYPQQLIQKCYISTEGNVYPCCLDYKTQLIYGNIFEKSIRDIWNSQRRKGIVWNILHKGFEKIGDPCLHCSEKNDFLRCYLNYLEYSVPRTINQLLTLFHFRTQGKIDESNY